MRQLIEDWDGLAVVSRFHRSSGAWIFIALHSAALGRPTGGTRVKRYERPEDGLRDAMRLAEGMTHKWAAVGLPVGGGKGVLALSREIDAAERASLLDTYADLLNALRGGFSTGQDLGTTPDDILALSARTRFVHGASGGDGEARDPGPYTARAVLAGIRAALAHRFGSPDLAGRRLLVQGLGGVGRPLARSAAAAGATLLVSDVAEARVRELTDELGCEGMAPDAVFETHCDVYAPCAVGATLNVESIPRLACAIVGGSANNQLAEEEDARRLHARGILYAPDFVINGGGALAFGLMARGERDEELIGRRLEALGTSLTAIFAEAAERDESPLFAARRRVDRILAGGPSASHSA
jgi:leucine dehydrogenase